MRIVEPFVKAHLALWLVARGGENIEVSVDGAEPHPGMVCEILTRAGFVRTPNKNSVAEWTGRYKSPSGAVVLVESKPGADVKAILPPNRHFLAECKGELTEKGTRAGNDKTAFYTGLGQLLVIAGQSERSPDVIALGLPHMPRFAEMAKQASTNKLLKELKVTVLLVNAQGQVT